MDGLYWAADVEVQLYKRGQGDPPASVMVE